MNFVGIDPGQKGGICILNAQGEIISIFPMCKYELLYNRLGSYNNIAHLVLEKAQAYPKQGVVSVFNYGCHYGILQGIIISLSIPFSLIPPRTWQKNMIFAFNKKLDAKEKALLSANRIFKKKSNFWLETSRCKKPHDGMIDAALIAEFCRKQIIK